MIDDVDEDEDTESLAMHLGATLRHIIHLLTNIDRKIDTMADVTQAELDGIAASILADNSVLASALTAIEAEIAALKVAQPALNLTALTDAVAPLTALVQQAKTDGTPPAPTPPPTPTPAPTV